MKEWIKETFYTTMNFPLYTSLISGIPEKALTVAQKNEFVKKVEKMDLGGHEAMFALLKFYYIENETNSPFTVPYNGEFVKNDVTFNLTSFPPKLQQILYKFI